MSYYIESAKAAKDGNINTFSQLMALGILNEAENGTTMTFMAKALGISTAAMTNIADKFSDDGLAHRVDDRHDRRVFRLTITNKGSELFKQILP